MSCLAIGATLWCFQKLVPCCGCVRVRVQRLIDWVKKTMMFGPMLGVACNGFIPLCISVNLNNKYGIKSKWGENIANNYSNVI